MDHGKLDAQGGLSPYGQTVQQMVDELVELGG